MKNAIIIYVVTQLISNAYGLAVLESVRPFVEEQLKDEGYHKNKNSLYRFNNTFSNVLKGLIPFYYLVKALKVITHKKDVSSLVQEQIDNKNYVNISNDVIKEEVTVIPETKTDDLVNNMNLVFEKPERYTARKNDYYLDTYETPIEYDTRTAIEDDNLDVSPFISDDKVVVIKNEEVESLKNEKEEVEVSNKAIAKAICDLSLEELVALREKIVLLEENKKLELKDVA